MQNVNRNTFVDGAWVLKKVHGSAIFDPFDCGDADLNEYFHKDAILHRKELLTQTYYFYLTQYPFVVLALLDFCNDAIRFDWSRATIEIDQGKQYPHMPAVKLTRFGVDTQFQGRSIGSHALNIVKKFFVTDNRTGCRFLTVDAYNEPEVLRFYDKNGFKSLTDKDKTKQTRSLYFDLKRLVVG